jgi:hypothetical protein
MRAALNQSIIDTLTKTAVLSVGEIQVKVVPVSVVFVA